MYWIINNITNISGYLMVRPAFRYRFPYWSQMSAACLTLTQMQRARRILICAVWRLTGLCILAYQIMWYKHWWWCSWHAHNIQQGKHRCNLQFCIDAKETGASCHMVKLPQALFGWKVQLHIVQKLQYHYIYIYI